MKTERSAQILTIRETPLGLWIIAIFFAAIGAVFVYGALGGYSNYSQITPFAIAVHLFGGLCGIAAGYWIIFIAPVTLITIDRSTETLTYRRRGLAGRNDAKYSFAQVRRFSLIEEIDSEGDPAFSLGLELANNELIRISAVQSPVDSVKRDIVFQANEFLYKQMPSYQAELEREDESWTSIL